MEVSDLLVSIGEGVLVGSAAFGAADDEFPTHEILIVEDIDGALGFVGGAHLDEGVSFRSLGVFMGDDFGVLDGTGSAEEFEEVAFGGIVREVTHVEPGVGDGDDFG